MASSPTMQSLCNGGISRIMIYFIDTAVISPWHQSHMMCTGISIQGKNLNSTYLPYMLVEMILANPHLLGIIWRRSVVLSSAFSFC